MLRNKKMLRFFGLLAGLAALVIVWLVVVQPLMNRSGREGLVAEEREPNGDDPLGGAIVDNEQPPVFADNDEDEPEEAETPTTPSPDELATTGGASLQIASMIGVTAAVYLVFLNRRIMREAKLAKSLTYSQE